MKLDVSWVIGRGLLGQHLELELATRTSAVPFSPAEAFSWRDPALLREQLSRAAVAFSSRLGAAGETPFLIAWTAGAGVIGSPSSVLAADEAALVTLLEVLDAAQLPAGGLLFVASTAGGAWGGSKDRPITEDSVDAPINDYGRTRIRMENKARAWVEAHAGWRGLVGRISTLFGTGQNLLKPQGFISHVSRSIIFGRPLNVFVSPHTLRDFLFAPDCAGAIVEAVLQKQETPAGSEPCPMQVFADERSVSLLQVIDALESVSKRRVMMTLRAHSSTAEQAPALVFKSRRARVGIRRRTDLITAVNLLHHHQFRAFQEGRLRPPPL